MSCLPKMTGCRTKQKNPTVWCYSGLKWKQVENLRVKTPLLSSFLLKDDLKLLHNYFYTLTNQCLFLSMRCSDRCHSRPFTCHLFTSYKTSSPVWDKLISKSEKMKMSLSLGCKILEWKIRFLRCRVDEGKISMAKGQKAKCEAFLQTNIA